MEDSGSSPSGVTGEPVDTSGLSFTATYDDGTTGSVIPSSYTPTSFGDTAGTQTVTFSFEGTDITVEVDYDVEAAGPQIEVSGSWTNTPYGGDRIKPAGLSFTYNGESISPDSYSCSVTGTNMWPTEGGSLNATFLFTIDGDTVSVDVPATVIAFSGVALTGTWTNTTQYLNRDIDYTGLTFTASWADGHTQVVTSQPDAGNKLHVAGVYFTEDGHNYASEVWPYEINNDTVTLCVMGGNTTYKYGVYDISAPAITVDRVDSSNIGDTITYSVNVDEDGVFEPDKLENVISSADEEAFVGLFVDDNFDPIEVNEGDIFGYLTTKSAYTNDDTLAGAVSGYEALVISMGIADSFIDFLPVGELIRAIAPDTSRFEVDASDCELYAEIDNEAQKTIVDGTELMFVVAKAPVGATSVDVSTYKPSDLTELGKWDITVSRTV